MKKAGRFAGIQRWLDTWWLPIVIIGPFISIGVFQAYTTHPQPPMLTEFNQVHIMPGSTRLSHDEDGRAGVISSRYAINSLRPDIRKYYMNELTSEGWRLSYSVGYGEGSIDYFCKDGYSAHLETAAQPDVEFGKTTYVIAVWRQDVVFPNPKTDCIRFGGYPYIPSGKAE